MNKETLEEAAEKLYPINLNSGSMGMLNRHQLNNSYKQEGFIEGAKWQAERSYSEEEVHNIIDSYRSGGKKLILAMFYNKWFEQFKKK